MPQLLKYIDQDVATTHGGKHTVFSYSMLLHLLSSFGTHGSGFKRKILLVCWERASCSVLHNTILFTVLLQGEWEQK